MLTTLDNLLFLHLLDDDNRFWIVSSKVSFSTEGGSSQSPEVSASLDIFIL